jgi:hypothetical protein
MLSRIRTPLLSRNPYLLGDMAWGVLYVLHGLAGAALIALALIHIYFALRPENRPITMSMLTGAMDREYYARHHDPRLWGGPGPRRVGTESAPPEAIAALPEVCAAAIADGDGKPEAAPAFLAVLKQDTANALAVVRLVLAQPRLSSQLIDNLNANIHLRTVLTDVFLLDEAFGEAQ